jgi:uncharacterized protein YndB with AHSA1/START domain
VGAVPEPTEVVVEHEVRIAASPETVFSYFTDPVRMAMWMGHAATIDPRPGGVCRVEMGNAAAAGEFVAIDPYERIVFTWGWEQNFFAVPPQSTEVEVTFTPEADGTVLRLTHRRLPSRDAAAFHRHGWGHYLGRLAIVATGADPGDDPLEDPAVALQAATDALRGAS